MTPMPHPSGQGPRENVSTTRLIPPGAEGTDLKSRHGTALALGRSLSRGVTSLTVSKTTVTQSYRVRRD